MVVASKQGSCMAAGALIMAELRKRGLVPESVRCADRCTHSLRCNGGCTCETSPIWRRSQARGRALMSVPSRSTCPLPVPPQHRAATHPFISGCRVDDSQLMGALTRLPLGTARRNTAQTSHRAAVRVVEPHDERHNARFPCTPGAPLLGLACLRARTRLKAVGTSGHRRGPAMAQ